MAKLALVQYTCDRCLGSATVGVAEEGRTRPPSRWRTVHLATDETGRQNPTTCDLCGSCWDGLLEAWEPEDDVEPGEPS